MSSSMPSGHCPLAIVTGASSGIGYEFAKCCARGGFDLLVAADEPAIQNAAEDGSVKNLGRYAASWIAGWPNRPSSTAALT